MIQTFKSPSVTTGRYNLHLHTCNTRQRRKQRQTSHRLELTAALQQNFGPTCFNKLPEQTRLERIQGNLMLFSFYVKETFVLCCSMDDFSNFNLILYRVSISMDTPSVLMDKDRKIKLRIPF